MGKNQPAFTPIIYSGEYRVKIDDFVLPTPIKGPDSKTGTQIILPFNATSMPSERAYVITERSLKNLEPSTLLFLNNIREIRWKNLESNGFILKSVKRVPKAIKARRVKIITGTHQEDYIVVYKPIRIGETELKVEVAYKLGKNGHNRNSIKPLELTSKLFVYFPTEKETYLNFFIHGPFRTTPNRENIPLDDDQNKSIIEEIANLVAESLPLIKKIGLLDIHFLGIMPIDLEKVGNYIYLEIFNKVKNKLMSEKLLPTLDHKYRRFNEIVIPKRIDLTALLKNNDLYALFSRRGWISSELNYMDNVQLRSYLTNVLGVKEVGNEDFATVVNAQFFEGKSDNWIRRFYSYISKYPNLWKDEGNKNGGILRNKPIIRLENEEMAPPFDSAGKAQVYLPSNNSHRYRTVKKYFVDHRNTERFLRELGLSEPDLFAEIYEHIFPNYLFETSNINQDYFDDVSKLLDAYEKLPQSRAADFLRRLKDCSFIISNNNLTSESCLKKASETYFDTIELREYFEGSKEANFVTNELIERFEDHKIETFLSEIGVLKYPRVIEKTEIANLSKDELRRRVGYTNRTVTRINYDFDGLDNLFDVLTPNKSVLLWKFLLKSIEDMSSWDAERFFKGVDKWYYMTKNSQLVDARFTIKLREKAWILDKNGNFRKPSELTFEEVSDLYLKESKNLETLKKILNFKPDYVMLLPEDDRERLELSRIIPIDKLRIMAKESSTGIGINADEEWTPEVGPEDAPINFSDYSPSKPIRKTSHYTKSENKNEPEFNHSIDEENENFIDTRGRKEIGNWGEKHVYQHLKEKYGKRSVKTEESIDGLTITDELGSEYEINWMNKNGNRGIGYDFLIKKDGKILEYIEVKAKIKATLEVVEMTGAQWELARELFEKNLGEKYSIYVVTSAGLVGKSKIQKLSNPFKMWDEGKIEAHPVNLIL